MKICYFKVMTEKGFAPSKFPAGYADKTDESKAM